MHAPQTILLAEEDKTTRAVLADNLAADGYKVLIAEDVHDALARQLGRDSPWPLADPASWKCSPRYCPHFAGCQGGLAGLPRAA